MAAIRSVKPVQKAQTRPATVAARRPGSPARPKFDYEYEPVTEETNAAVATSAGSGYDGIFQSGYTIFKPKEGQNDIRILPRTFDWKKLKVAQHWAYPIQRHTNIGPDRAGYLCRRLMLAETCALCEERRLVGNDQDLLKQLRPTPAAVVWLIDRANEGAGPQLWAMPAQKVEVELCVRSKAKGSQPTLQITHPDEGFDISFSMKKQGKDAFPQYSAVDISRDPSPISDNPDLQRKWMQFIIEHPLDTMLRWFEDSYIFQVYAGQAEKEDEDLGEGPQSTAVETDVKAEHEPEPAEEEVVEEEGGETVEEGNGVDEAEVTYEDIRAMTEEQLGEFAASRGLEFDMSEYDDLENAQESFVAHFFGEVPPREKKPKGIAKVQAKPAATPEKVPPRTNSGNAAVTDATSRLRALGSRTSAGK